MFRLIAIVLSVLLISTQCNRRAPLPPPDALIVYTTNSGLSTGLVPVAGSGAAWSIGLYTNAPWSSGLLVDYINPYRSSKGLPWFAWHDGLAAISG